MLAYMQLLEASMIKQLEGAYSLSPLQDGNVEVCVCVCVCVCVFYLRARSLSSLARVRAASPSRARSLSSLARVRAASPSHRARAHGL